MNFQLIAYGGANTPRYENGCFYAIRCKENDFMYVGATGQPYKQRFGEHKSTLKRQCHRNSKLQEAFDKYGEDNFESFVLDDGYHSQFQLDLLEDHIIDIYRPKVFNIRKGGLNAPNAVETRQKMSEAQKGEKNHMYGKKQSEEHKRKNSLTTSRQMNKTGLYRVQKQKDSHCKQGFRWKYQYYDNGKHKSISSIDLFTLKDKVLAKGFEWRIIDGTNLERTLKDLIPIVLAN